MKKFFSLYIVVIFIIGCDKDNSEKREEKPKEITITTDIKRINYPGGEYCPYTRDPIEYVYENGKIVKSFNYSANKVYSYPAENVIRIESINPSLSNATEKATITYHISNEKLQYVIVDKYFKFSNHDKAELVRDSTVYQYQNEHLLKVLVYLKGDVNYFYSYPDYQLEMQCNLTWENENISKIEFYEKGVLVEEKNYQYDNTSYVTYGEFSFETPFDVLGSLIMYGKLGKWNKNNVISLTNAHRPSHGSGFKTIRYRREFDKHNRLVKIHTEGEVIGSNDSHPNHGKYFKGEFPAELTYD